MFQSYRISSIDLQSKLIDWFAWVENWLKMSYPVIYLLKVNNKSTSRVWNMFKVNNKDIRTTPLQYRRSDVFILNSEHISNLVLFLLLLLNI